MSINVSLTIKNTMAAVCLIDKGYEIKHISINKPEMSALELELYTITTALKTLKQYIEQQNDYNDVVYFESNLLFPMKWLKPAYNLDIETEVIPLYEELVTTRESIPMSYNFVTNTKTIAQRYIGEDYIEKPKIVGLSLDDFDNKEETDDFEVKESED